MSNLSDSSSSEFSDAEHRYRKYAPKSLDQLEQSGGGKTTWNLESNLDRVTRVMKNIRCDRDNDIKMSKLVAELQDQNGFLRFLGINTTYEQNNRFVNDLGRVSENPKKNVRLVNGENESLIDSLIRWAINEYQYNTPEANKNVWGLLEVLTKPENREALDILDEYDEQLDELERVLDSHEEMPNVGRATMSRIVMDLMNYGPRKIPLRFQNQPQEQTGGFADFFMLGGACPAIQSRSQFEGPWERLGAVQTRLTGVRNEEYIQRWDQGDLAGQLEKPIDLETSDEPVVGRVEAFSETSVPDTSNKTGGYHFLADTPSRHELLQEVPRPTRNSQLAAFLESETEQRSAFDQLTIESIY